MRFSRGEATPTTIQHFLLYPLRGGTLLPPTPPWKGGALLLMMMVGQSFVAMVARFPCGFSNRVTVDKLFRIGKYCILISNTRLIA
jgi:hypothetical protein